MTLEWGNEHIPYNLLLTERDGTIYVFDVRKLASAQYVLPNAGFVPESCVFSPDGDYLLVDSVDDDNNQGSSLIRIYPWKQQQRSIKSIAAFPSHGPLYSMQFSPDNKFLATGGADAR